MVIHLSNHNIWMPPSRASLVPGLYNSINKSSEYLPLHSSAKFKQSDSFGYTENSYNSALDYHKINKDGYIVRIMKYIKQRLSWCTSFNSLFLKHWPDWFLMHWMKVLPQGWHGQRSWSPYSIMIWVVLWVKIFFIKLVTAGF